MGLVIYETVVGCERPWFDEASDVDVKARILGGEFRWNVVERYDVELSNLLRCVSVLSSVGSYIWERSNGCVLDALYVCTKAAYG